MVDLDSASTQMQLGDRARTGGLDHDPQSVRALIERACDAMPFQSVGADAIARKLRALASRFEEGQLQLAVVGQFKRGKSTLLNALMGAPILPSAVTPLTGIPTFIRGGLALGLHTERTDNQREDIQTASVDELRSLLAARVTEERNPHNRVGYRKVEVLADAPLLHEGLVLIDTPGVGSTFRHNTDAARAALPECDMALFVVSPDPPITEVELSYLRELQAVTSHFVIVLNKIDLVEGDDRLRSEQFLSDTVVEATSLSATWFFSVSAKTALAAKLKNDKQALATSGLLALENYLIQFARNKRSEVLAQAVIAKAAGLVRELLFEVQSRLSAYKMPIADLSDRLVKFESARAQFESTRRENHDLLVGERRRLLSDLDTRSAMLRKAVEIQLFDEADALLKTDMSEVEVVVSLQDGIPARFQRSFETFEADARESTSCLLSVYQKKGDDLIGRVRRLAATLLDIPFSAPVAEEAFQAKKTPYWVSTPRESLMAMPNVVDTLLPTTMRKERIRERLRRQITELTTRNIENLRWAIRQNLESSIRTFDTQLDNRLHLSQEATARAMREAIQRRSLVEASSKGEIVLLEQAQEQLLSFVDQLSHSGD